MCHKYNDLKSKFVQNVPLMEGKVLDSGDEGIKITFKSSQ
jgi:hypothetical protein